jgi:hypothetical protein
LRALWTLRVCPVGTKTLETPLIPLTKELTELIKAFTIQLLEDNH